ncbi:hypothetical protein AN195_04225 [Salmonella enterica subsp. enterica serovar Enteritidis]|nr:hypothetical protein AN195_04225 [Salmonella enterica subsp. enterica serovar Enteritidis]
MIYALSGVFYAFGGLLEAGRIGSATNNLGFMYELDAIAACVVGGVSFSGGVGTVFGVVTGVIIFTVINYGLTYIGLDNYFLRAYFSESSATAKMIMPPLIMYCQYGFTPITLLIR